MRTFVVQSTRESGNMRKHVALYQPSRRDHSTPRAELYLLQYKFLLTFIGLRPTSLSCFGTKSSNNNALLENSFATMCAQNGTTTITGMVINLNFSLASACDILPTIPPKFYCRVHGHSIQFKFVLHISAS